MARKDNLSDFLKLALDNCMNLLKSKTGSIFLFDSKKQELILKLYCDSTAKKFGGIKERLGEGVSGMVAFQREPLLVKDVRRDPRFRDRKRFGHYRTYSFLSSPLIAADKLIGVININEKISGKPFTSNDLQLLSLISDYIAVVIYSNRIFKKNKHDGMPPKEMEDIKYCGQEKIKEFASIGKLVAGIAHELNNPLDGVMRYVNLSLGCLNEDGIIREYLINAKKGLNRIAGIIRSLLDFAQTSSPAFNRQIEINRAIEDSLLMSSHHIISNNIKVVKQLKANLPPVRDNGIKLALINIIKNACDAIGDGGGTITVTTKMKDGRVEIRFKDTGCGIPEEIRGKIFEPFFTTKELGKGSGLGLAICYDIIKRHNGKIRLEENSEKGASFVIELPADAYLPAGDRSASQGDKAHPEEEKQK